MLLYRNYAFVFFVIRFTPPDFLIFMQYIGIMTQPLCLAEFSRFIEAPLALLSVLAATFVLPAVVRLWAKKARRPLRINNVYVNGIMIFAHGREHAALPMALSDPYIAEMHDENGHRRSTTP